LATLLHGRQSGFEQGFISVDVPDARHNTLIQQDCLETTFRGGQAPAPVIRIQIKGLRAKAASEEELVQGSLMFQPGHAAKSADVAKTQLPLPIVQTGTPMGMIGHLLGGINDRQLTGHTKVNHQELTVL
jgi:hypothetical protein